MKNLFNQKIIDAHHHFWEFDDNKHSWLKENENINFHKNYLANNLVNDSKSLQLIKTVHIQAEIDREYSLYETEWLQKISNSREDNFPNAILAYIDLTSPNIEEVIENHRKFKNFRGFRQILRFDKNNADLTDTKIDYLNNDLWINNMSYIEKNDLIFELLIYYHQYEDATKLINKYSNIKFIINHSLSPQGINISNIEKWKIAINKLSNYSNVYIKLSGFGEIFPNWSLDTIKPFIDFSLNKFGTDRCMFGSNFPVDKFISSSAYPDYWQSYYEIVKDFSQSELDKIFYKNAEIFYNI